MVVIVISARLSDITLYIASFGWVHSHYDPSNQHFVSFSHVEHIGVLNSVIDLCLGFSIIV